MSMAPGRREMTSRSRQHRRGVPALLRASLALLAAACATGNAVERTITHDNPGAAYETRTDGCGPRIASGRKFGNDLRGAILWTGQTADDARALPCVVTVFAVRGDVSRPVYRITRSTTGTRIEAPVAPTGGH